MPESWYPSSSRCATPSVSHARWSSPRRIRATSASSWPSSPGLIPPGASPSSPFVQVTTTVRTPSSAYRASTPPVLDDSSSGCACTAISVSGVVIRQACHDAGQDQALMLGAFATSSVAWTRTADQGRWLPRSALTSADYTSVFQSALVAQWIRASDYG